MAEGGLVMENETERKLKEAVRLLRACQRMLLSECPKMRDSEVSSAPLQCAIQSWIANNELQPLLKD